MNTIIQKDIRIRVAISIRELLIIPILTVKTIIMTGIQIATQEFKKNLHLITACLRSHLNVNQKFDNVKVMLFITASRAE